MLSVIACLVGVLAILLITEILWQHKVLKDEQHRKVAHIGVGSFVAFWPWLISWRSIQLIGAAMLVVVLLNRGTKILHFLADLRSETYGDIFFGLAIISVALLTTTKIFFTLAILHMSLADSLAALVGKNYGQKWRYKVFYQTNTVIGSMTFWFVSLCILGVGILFAHNLIAFGNYAILLLVLPPILVLLENFAILGVDNIVVPLVVLLALNLAQAS